MRKPGWVNCGRNRWELWVGDHSYEGVLGYVQLDPLDSTCWHAATRGKTAAVTTKRAAQRFVRKECGYFDA